MNVSASSTGTAPPPSAGSAGSSGGQEAPTGNQTPLSENPDLGLEIQDDQAAGAYVYKTIDRRTGAVVSQWPTEQLLRLREAPSYAAGSLIRQVA